MTAIIAATFSDRARIAIDSYLAAAAATVNISAILPMLDADLAPV